MNSRPILLIEIAPEYAIKGIPPVALIGQSYSYQFSTYGGQGATTYQIDPVEPLPAGWALSSSGLLTHAASVSGPVTKFTFRVIATDNQFRSVATWFVVAKENPLP